MSVFAIVVFVFVVVLLYILYHYATKNAHTLSGLTSAKTMQRIDAGSLTDPTVGASSNFAYSIWYFIDDWNYRYGESKILFGRMIAAEGSNAGNVLQPCPSVTFGPIENNLKVSLTVYPGTEDDTPVVGSHFVEHHCGIENVPIQKWCNVLISVLGRTLDIYLDGKLVRTSVLPGVAKIDVNSSVYITPMGGFSGWTSKFEYWNNAMNPQEAWNVYAKGYGGSTLGNLFGRYSVKVTVMDNDQESGNVSF